MANGNPRNVIGSHINNQQLNFNSANVYQDYKIFQPDRQKKSINTANQIQTVSAKQGQVQLLDVDSVIKNMKMQNAPPKKNFSSKKASRIGTAGSNVIMKSPSKEKRGKDEIEMENYTQMMINNPKFRDELVNNPIITYLVKSNILNTEKKQQEMVSPKSENTPQKQYPRESGQLKWNTDQKIQLQIENKEDGSPTQRTIYIKNSQVNTCSPKVNNSGKTNLQLQKEVDKNKEFQNHLKQYMSSNVDHSNDPNILQMQNYLLKNSYDDAGKIRAKSSGKKCKTQQPSNGNTLNPQPIFINHGDINININVGSEKDASELHNLLYQNMILQQQQAQYQQMHQNRSHASINEQLENYSAGLQASHDPISKQKQRLNLAKNFNQSPKTAKPRLDENNYSDFINSKVSTQNSQVFDNNDKKKYKKYSKSSTQGSQVSMQQSMSKQQLKKQVVQYYWQSLVQSYGIENKVKLDVKGKTINGYNIGPLSIQGKSNIKEQNLHLIQQQAQMQMLQGMGGRFVSSQMSPETGNHPPNCNCAYHQKNRFLANNKFDVISHQNQEQQQRLNFLTEMYQNRNSPNYTPQSQSQWYNQLCQIQGQIQEKNEQQLKNQLFGSMNNPNFGWNPQEFQFMNSSNMTHLFDQFGNHSHQCKCMKLRAQENILKSQIFIHKEQQLQQQKNTQSAPKKKQKAPVVPLTRMESINQFIQRLNQLILITLKATDSITPLALGQIKKLGQEIGIKWQNYLDAKFIKSKDFVTFLKSKIYVLLNNLLMKSNTGLFDQVQLMSQENSPNKKKEGAEINHQWLNQVQIYNLLKFKNLGFKFWVECPTTYGNNFIVVRSVTKRRVWLTWVDFDPYEDRTEQPDENIINEDSDYEEPQRFGVIFPNVIYTQVRRLKIIQDLLPHQIYNHIDGINQVATKCQLHRNMKDYAKNVLNEDPWKVMPETYIIDLQDKMNAKYVLDHEEFKEFQQAFKKDSWWIIKPGEDANRGHGIKVFNNLQKIKDFITYEFNSGVKSYKTCIIQKYIENPYLIHRRKFDIRVFALLTYISNFEKGEGVLRGWFYEEGYIRTSSKEFTMAYGENLLMHLTNDAVQKQSQDYGKYEAGNKISYSDFDKQMLKDKDVSFNQKILPQIKKRVGDTFKSTGQKFIGEVRSDYNGFEWLGFDFMIDDDMNLTLIEVNTNPCLETQSCILLQRLIPQMIDQSLKVAVDPFFGANEQQYLMNQEFVATEVKYSMVFEETIEGIKNSPSREMHEAYYSPQARLDENEKEQKLQPMVEEPNLD